ncbi:hypothetical protein IA539_10300 [Gordonia sp. zg691]|uniref:DUF485 domain-containing protein n=1 Tax=Gordonia jinghuaiqii TaxID=2758710 RepID=A0A7D7LXH7_9ACTN|nr:hypothetical protein [Gordonia jinghuaiqii]MBD0861596.1 hypothetical protein [Gordonia jinghuaiqii]MCR5977468.1 hypothetical protein [Gordonia jinghuaiqii]QMT02159.1 hypothetical protein H1R19_02970 [Gordonia jinghuaiqii]
MTEYPPQRERVVLSTRRGARMVRTRVEVQEQTEVGDALVRGLMRAQLGLALRLGGSALVLFMALPLVAYVFPGIAEATVFGIRLTWISLGLLAFPVLYLTGALYVRLAEQAERDFMGLVDDDMTDSAGDDPAAPADGSGLDGFGRS